MVFLTFSQPGWVHLCIFLLTHHSLVFSSFSSHAGEAGPLFIKLHSPGPGLLSCAGLTLRSTGSTCTVTEDTATLHFSFAVLYTGVMVTEGLMVVYMAMVVYMPSNPAVLDCAY